MEPGFLLSYWRPWNENSSFVDSWGNYLRDTSLVDYGVNKIGEHIKSAASALGFEISKVSEQLEFLNWRTQVLIEQQKLSNLLLNNVAELLKIPDYEKERIQEITFGIIFFSNASKNPKFFIDSLEHFLKAEELMSQDYFVLFHIGCIYLYSPNLLNLEKATDYFLRAGEYAEVECDPSAVRLSNQLTNRVNNKYTEQTSRTESIKLLTSDIFKNTALCYYILGKDCSAIDYQMKATKFCNSPENKVLLAKYLIRNSQINESLKYLEAAVNETPELLGAVICDADIAGERQVIDFAHKKNHEIELSVEDCATEALIRGDKTAFLNIIAAAQGSYIEQVAAVNEGLRVYHSVQKRIEIDWGEYKSKDGLVAYRGQSIFGGAINSDYYRISLRVFFPRNNDAYEIKLIARFWQNDDYAPQSVITPARLFIKTEDGTNKQLESVQVDKGYSYLDKKKVTSFRFPVEEEVLLSFLYKSERDRCPL